MQATEIFGDTHLLQALNFAVLPFQLRSVVSPRLQQFHVIVHRIARRQPSGSNLILVIEDDQVFRELVSTYLKHIG
jgi:hypothetical protein